MRSRMAVWVFLLMLGLLPRTASQSPVRYVLEEENPRGAFVGNITADSGIVAQYSSTVLKSLQFSFLEQPSSYEDLFRLDRATGVLWADKVINRETICAYSAECVIPLDVQVQPPEYFQIIKVEVDIKDINDNTPLFPDQILVRHLTEASTVDTPITIPIADDPDSPAFGIQHYRIISGSTKFELREATNMAGAEDIHLVLKERLDREQQDLYTIQIVAYDGGIPPKSGTTTVNIVVLDVNDNNPQFDQQTYEITVNENIGTMSTVMAVTAVDPDEGLNGEVAYGFSSKTEAAFGDLFMIMETTGEIIVIGELDYEQEETYTLMVTAKDKNPNSVPARAKVIIHVQDLNDHPPVIKVNTQTRSGDLEVSEFAVNNTFVAHITVTDPDSGENGEFDCSLNSPKFALSRMYSTEFKIVAMTTFDREEQAEYEVTLRCEDKGTTPQTSEVQLKVKVMDENDFQPVFTKSLYTASILENNEVGAYLTSVKAVDQDEGENANITYDIAEDMKDLFTINLITGDVYVKVIFNREERDQVNFTVFATDNGSPSFTGSALVLVSVMDKDDEVPGFLQTTYSFSLPENEAPPKEVGRVIAVDKDLPPFNRFDYAIDPASSQGVTNMFSIDSKQGIIYSEMEFDREEIPMYQFRVKAISSSLRPVTSYATVTVDITDKNDNGPIIEFPNHLNDTVYLDIADPNMKPGFILATVLAYDDDSGTNADLSYSILNNADEDTDDTQADGGELAASSLVYIDSSLGTVAVAKEISEITLGDFEIPIKVTDEEYPYNWQSATLKVSVFDSSITSLADSSKASSNVNILIAIVVVCFIVAAILVLAIAYIMRKKKKEVKKYKWVAQIKAAQPALENLKLAYGDKESILPANRQSPSPTEGKILNTNQNGFTNTTVNDNEDIYVDMGHNIQRSSSSGSTGMKKHIEQHRRKNSGRLKHKIIYQPEHTIRKPAVFNPNPDPMRQSPGMDHDSESGFSVTDSGRGSTVSEGVTSVPPLSPPWEFITQSDESSLERRRQLVSGDIVTADIATGVHRSCLRNDQGEEDWAASRGDNNTSPSNHVRFVLPAGGRSKRLGSVAGDSLEEAEI